MTITANAIIAADARSSEEIIFWQGRRGELRQWCVLCAQKIAIQENSFSLSIR